MGNHCFQSAIPPNWFLALHEGRVFLEPFFSDVHCKFHLDKHSNHYVIRNHNFHYLAASATGQLYVHNTHNHFDCKFKLEQAPQFGGKYMFQSYHGSYLGVRNGMIGCFMEFTPSETWNMINNFSNLPQPNSVAVGGVPMGGPMVGQPMAGGMGVPMGGMQPGMQPGYGQAYGGMPGAMPGAYPQQPGAYPQQPGAYGQPVYQLNPGYPGVPGAYPNQYGGAPGGYPGYQPY